MKIGRIKIWFASKKIRLERKFKGSLAVFWLLPKEKDLSDDVVNPYRATRGIIHHFPSKKALEEQILTGKWKDFDYGHITYWFWRFSITVRTPKYHSSNSW